MLRRWSSTKGYGLLACGLALAFAGAAAAGIAVHSKAGAARRMTVSLREYKITAKRTAATGRMTFVAVNKGHIAHSLAISGPGIRKKRIVGLVAPGKTKTLTVTLKHGTYKLWCPVPGHAALGMTATLRVGAAAGGAVATNTNSTTTSGGGAEWG